MKFKFKVIDLRNIKGIRGAERLKRLGWSITSVGFTTVVFEKTIQERR
jgi:hypothetical protein